MEERRRSDGDGAAKRFTARAVYMPDATVLMCAGPLDAASVDEFERIVLPIVELAVHRVVFDLERVTEIDAAGARALGRAAAHVPLSRERIVARHLPEGMRQRLEGFGLAQSIVIE